MHPNVILKTGDITKEKSCAIVNAANSSLMGGGGVDGAIHRAGGKQIAEECERIRKKEYPDGLPTGKAVATTAGNMPSRYVIHTVGPIYRHCADRCAALLASSYTQSLRLARKLGCADIAFPAISTGIYGYPKKEAAKVAYRAVKNFLQENKDMTVYFIFHKDEDREVFEQAIRYPDR